jgi:hypothetical protein
MSWPEAFQPNETLGIDQILPTVPRDFGERFTLDWRAARSPDRWLRYEMRMQELYDDALDKLRTATGQNLLPPERSGARIAIGGGLGIASAEAEGASRRDRAMKDVVTALDSARELAPDLPDPREFDGKVTAESTEMRKAAQRAALASYGAGGLGAFLGATAGEMSHPAQIATLPLGGTYAASSIARVGLLRFIGRAAVTEGAVAAAAQIGVEALDAPYQARLATDGPGSGNEFGDRIERVLFAAAGGALIGGGLAGIVAAARGVSRRLRPTVDEADALKVAERAVYGEQRNPLGPDGINAHTTALNKAEVEVSAGRHADVREIVAEEVRRQVMYHGSAKRFERFEASQIDSGAGAQGGHGIYLAESKDIAEAYVMPGGALYRVEMRAPREAFIDADATLSKQSPQVQRAVGETLAANPSLKAPAPETKMGDWMAAAEAQLGGPKAAAEALAERGVAGMKQLDSVAREMGRDTRNYVVFDDRALNIVSRTDEPFDILDSAAATRPIADNAPMPPEKPPTGMKEAKADEARALVLAKDFEVSVPSGDGFVKKMASEMLAEADDKVRAARIAAECAAGGAIG